MISAQPRRGSTPGIALAVAGLTGVVLATVVTLTLVLVSVTDSTNTSAPGYLPLAWSATAVLVTVFVIGLLVRRFDLQMVRGFPWLIGVLSFVVSFVPWLGLTGVNPDLGTLIYRGLKVPQGIMQFWDLTLVMQSIDCARWGFDIYAFNNGCMQDASIYAPGMAWLQFIPLSAFSVANVPALGIGMVLVSSLALVWLARQSTGPGQVILAVAAVGGPWLLVLERGNIDAVVLWAAIVAVLITRRWSSLSGPTRLWPWVLAAAVLWLMGTWKYYPFALGVMLLPTLRIRSGWMILSGYVLASLAFVGLTWQNFRFSAASNASMIDYGDFVVLGRVPVVARMLGTEVGVGGLQLGDLMLFLLALMAFMWGIGIGMRLSNLRPWLSMLASGGAVLFLASVLVAGFGWGYKAVFLLLAVPLVSQMVTNRQRVVVSSALTVLLLLGVSSVVVWNTVMVTTAGIIAAGFTLGLSLELMIRLIRKPVQVRLPATG